MANEIIKADGVEIVGEKMDIMTAAMARMADNPVLKVTSTGEAVFDFAAMAQEAGLTQVPLQALKQVQTADVVNQPLTIMEVNIATAVSKSGENVLYPVMRFLEIPDSYYGGGGLLTRTMMLYCVAAGDEWKAGVPVNLNNAIQNAGGIRVILTLKPNKTDRSRQDYVAVTVLS